MINIFVQIIKIEKMNLSAQALINQLLVVFLASDNNVCCACGRKGTRYLRQYSRWLTEWRHGKIVETEIVTGRYICECGKTHVLLPSLIIPYSHYSLPLIIHALHDYYSHSLTVNDICSKYSISVPTLYRWKKLFERDKEFWLKGLKNIETSPYAFLKKLLLDEDWIRFASEFRKSVFPHRMFLQNHANAFLHRFV